MNTIKKKKKKATVYTSGDLRETPSAKSGLILKFKIEGKRA